MGFQAAIHTNGDYEIDMVLDALEYATADDDREHRHRIEHGSIVSPQILERMRKLAIVLAPHSYIYEKGPIVEQYGPKLWPLMFANGSTFEYGIPNAGNSDYPIAGLSPMLRIQSLVTRTSREGNTYGPEQRLTVEQALHAYTMGGAYATFEEDMKGSISVGKFADFVILSDDPRSVPPLEIRKIEVEATSRNQEDRSGSHVRGGRRALSPPITGEYASIRGFVVILVLIEVHANRVIAIERIEVRSGGDRNFAEKLREGGENNDSHSHGDQTISEFPSRSGVVDHSVPGASHSHLIRRGTGMSRTKRLAYTPPMTDHRGHE